MKRLVLVLPLTFLVGGGLLVVAEGRSPSRVGEGRARYALARGGGEGAPAGRTGSPPDGPSALGRRERGRGPPGVDHLRGRGHGEEAPAHPEAPDDHARRRQGPAFDAAAELAGPRARARRRAVLLRLRGGAGPAVRDGRRHGSASRRPPEDRRASARGVRAGDARPLPHPALLRGEVRGPAEERFLALEHGRGRHGRGRSPGDRRDAPASRRGRVPHLPVRRCALGGRRAPARVRRGARLRVRRGRRRRPER